MDTNICAISVFIPAGQLWALVFNGVKSSELLFWGQALQGYKGSCPGALFWLAYRQRASLPKSICSENVTFLIKVKKKKKGQGRSSSERTCRSFWLPQILRQGGRLCRRQMMTQSLADSTAAGAGKLDWLLGCLLVEGRSWPIQCPRRWDSLWSGLYSLWLDLNSSWAAFNVTLHLPSQGEALPGSFQPEKVILSDK